MTHYTKNVGTIIRVTFCTVLKLTMLFKLALSVVNMVLFYVKLKCSVIINENFQVTIDTYYYNN